MRIPRSVWLFFYAGLGFSLALSISFSLIFSYALAGLLLFEWSQSRNDPHWKTTPFTIPLVVYFVWGLVVTLLASSASLRKAASAQSGFLLFFLMVYALRSDDVKILIRWFCIGIAVAGLWGILQKMSGINFHHTMRMYEAPAFFEGWPEWIVSNLSARNGRPIGSRSHPLTYAEGFMPAFFFLSVALITYLKGKDVSPRRFWSHFLVLSLTVVGIILAEGRAVWLGCGLGSLLLLRLIPAPYRWKITLSAVLLGVFVLTVSPSLRGRVLSIFSQHGTRHDQESKSLRMIVWTQTLNLIKEKPILGYGLKGVVIPVKYPSTGEVHTWSEAHCVYFQTVLERGFIGLGLLFWILILIGRGLFQLPPPWSVGMAALFLAFLIAGLTESWMKDKEVSLIFWTFVGCCHYFRTHPKEILE